MLLLSLAMVAVPVQPARPVPVSEQIATQSRARLALELTEVLNSVALTRAQLNKLMDESLPVALSQNPDATAIEREYPGSLAVMIAAMRPLLVAHTLQSLPELWREVAPVYAEAFTEAELRQLLAFYRGPTGVRLVEAMGRGADYSSTINRMLESQDTKITANDLKVGASRGIAQVIREANATDMAAMVALMRTDAGKKLPGATAIVQQRVAQWAGKPTPEIDAEVEKAIGIALENHFAKGKKP